MTLPDLDARPRPDLGRAALLVLGLTTLVAVLLTAFTWPTSQLEPRSLPVVVAGPAAAADRVEDQLDQRAGADAFAVSTVADRPAAIGALRDREAYAGVVPSPDGRVEILVASAASPAVAQLLGEIADGMEAQVTDVVAAPADDPRGAAFGSSALPLVLAGLLTGAVVSLSLATTSQRISVALAAALASGVVLAGVLQGWLDVLGGSYWANAGVIALGIAAIAMSVVGLVTRLGHLGLSLAALTMMLVGNPLSGITSAPELVPLGWLGQLLPPGATGTALRSTAFFDGAGSGLPLLVLACWTLAGLALTVAPRRRDALT